ncbi:hypothetical protein QTP88_002850 [Uroleucon formosanum]
MAVRIKDAGGVLVVGDDDFEPGPAEKFRRRRTLRRRPREKRILRRAGAVARELVGRGRPAAGRVI